MRKAKFKIEGIVEVEIDDDFPQSNAYVALKWIPTCYAAIKYMATVPKGWRIEEEIYPASPVKDSTP